jgi:hypothetical protein
MTTPTAPLSTHWPVRTKRPTHEQENEVRREVFKLGRNPYQVMRERGMSKSMMDRICCHAVDWRKWGKAAETQATV